MSKSWRGDTYFASTTFNNRLHNCQSESYALTIHLRVTLQLAKSGEQLRDVLSGYPNARVSDFDSKAFKLLIVADLNFDASFTSKLLRVLNQIDQNLF